MGVSFIAIGKTGGGIDWEEIKNLLRSSNGHSLKIQIGDWGGEGMW